MVHRFFSSPVGMKLVMAVSGIVMVLFVIAHLSGNLLVFFGPQAIDEYARGLRKFMPILWVLRIGLILAAILHIASGIRLSLLNKRARPSSYAVAKPVKASLSSRYMIFSGLTLLFFIVYHLAHLTFRVTHQEFRNLGEYDVYNMLLISFKSPSLALFYALSIVMLMSHLGHGIASLFQTLGINGQRITPIIQLAATIVSVSLALGFISIPVSIYFGFIGAN